MSWPNTKAIGKFGNRGFIQESFLDQTHTARHRRCSSAPRGASWCRLGAAAKAWPEACPLRGGCRTKEQDIRRSGGSHRTDWTAIDPGRANAREIDFNNGFVRDKGYLCDIESIAYDIEEDAAGENGDELMNDRDARLKSAMRRLDDWVDELFYNAGLDCLNHLAVEFIKRMVAKR